MRKAAITELLFVNGPVYLPNPWIVDIDDATGHVREEDLASLKSIVGQVETQLIALTWAEIPLEECDSPATPPTHNPRPPSLVPGT